MDRKSFLRSALLALAAAGIPRAALAAPAVSWYTDYKFRFSDGFEAQVQCHFEDQAFLGTAPFQTDLWVQRKVPPSFLQTGTYVVERVTAPIRSENSYSAQFKASSYSNDPVLKGKLPTLFRMELDPGKLLRVELEADRFAALSWHVPTGPTCFLTTACTATRGLPDDCRELQSMRKLRDQHLLQSPEGTRMVKDYYHIAPELVSILQSRTNSQDLWNHLYSHLLLPTADLVEAGQMAEAATLYAEYVALLEETFLK